LKLELARQYPRDIEAYMAGKDALIKKILHKAHQWRGRPAG
jgi:GrpB-like predicted nucleotidyltransferase (UPF0157 family)